MTNGRQLRKLPTWQVAWNLCRVSPQLFRWQVMNVSALWVKLTWEVRWVIYPVRLKVSLGLSLLSVKVVRTRRLTPLVRLPDRLCRCLCLLPDSTDYLTFPGTPGLLG